MLSRSTGRGAAAAASILALTIALASCSGGNSDPGSPAQVDAAFPEATQTQLQSALDAAIAAAGATGAIVGVWAPWSGSWISATGVGQPDQAFRFADMTRPMTCDAMYSLAAEGSIRLDDPPSRSVGTVAGLPESVTVQQLCDGTSGIGSYGSILAPKFLEMPDRVWNPSELVAYGVGTYDPAVAGTYRDSDAGYVLLGQVLARAARTDASNVLSERVFEPLGLDRTRLPGPEPAPPGEPALPGYVTLPGPDGVRDCSAPTDYTVISPSIGSTDSGAVGTIEDLAQYSRALATGALLPEGTDRFASAVPVPGQPSWVAVGGGAIRAGSLVGQFGSITGYLTAAFSDPQTGLTVAVVLNNSTAGDAMIAYLAWELAAIASKAPAAPGRENPEAGLPWTAQQFHDQIAAAAICPPAA
jgi:D-alanyl-D-alanine carboxypeptidase